MTTTEINNLPNSDQLAEMQRLKQYFPFRIVWGMFDKVTGEWSTQANSTCHRMNRASRDGHRVFRLSK